MNCNFTFALTLIEYIKTITAEYPKIIPQAINTELEISPIGGDNIPTIIRVIPAKNNPITVIWHMSKNEYFLRNDIVC